MVYLQIAQGVGSFIDASNKAKQQEVRYQQNRQRAVAARDLKIQSLNTRLIQESEIAAQQKFQLAIESLKKKESAVVAQEETGLVGATFDGLLDEYDKAKLRTTDIINTNVENLEKQIRLEGLGADAEAENWINSMPRGQKPNFLLHAIGTASSAYAANIDYNVEMPEDYTSTFD